ncbi:MAG: hypothetical protein OES24_10620 [Acidimicrobiia bacterium]|nr:hypothetical protein [Acidimicrobiia bacterium]
MIELRLGNQQRHSITAVLLSAVVIIFGLVLVDVLSNSEPEPLGGQTRAVDTSSSSADLGVSESNDDLTAGVARSNARFTLNPDVTVFGSESTTSTTVPRKTTTAAVVATLATTSPTTFASSTSASTTSSTEPPETSASSGTSSTTETTNLDPRPKPSTTVVDDETTTTKKCRGNRPDCRKP